MSERFHFRATPITDLCLIERKPITDDRGFFSRYFCAQEFNDMGFMSTIAQINHTMTCKKGTVRGIHFQNPPYSEIKIITCLQGEVWDVAVDIRKDSQTFLQWHAEILTADNQKSFYVPKGFAHGFQTLTDDCQLLYLHSDFYQPEFEDGLNYRDQSLAIDWPLKIQDLSEKDKNLPMLDEEFEGIELI